MQDAADALEAASLVSPPKAGEPVAWRVRERYPMDPRLDAAVITHNRWEYHPHKPRWAGEDNTSEAQPLYAAPNHEARGGGVREAALAPKEPEAEHVGAEVVAPDGWVLVPREPTKAMLDAAMDDLDWWSKPTELGSTGEDAKYDSLSKDTIASAFAAMLAASPQPSSVGGEREAAIEECAAVADVIADEQDVLAIGADESNFAGYRQGERVAKQISDLIRALSKTARADNA
jgi:hypothetical protein